jgi:DNA-binding Xre family transcriptional regulator
MSTVNPVKVDPARVNCKKLRHAMSKRGVSVYSLAKKTDLWWWQIQKLVKGTSKRAIPQARLTAVCKALAVPVGAVVTKARA